MYYRWCGSSHHFPFFTGTVTGKESFSGLFGSRSPRTAFPVVELHQKGAVRLKQFYLNRIWLFGCYKRIIRYYKRFLFINQDFMECFTNRLCFFPCGISWNHLRNVEDWEAHTAYTHGLHKEFRAKGVENCRWLPGTKWGSQIRATNVNIYICMIYIYIYDFDESSIKYIIYMYTYTLYIWIYVYIFTYLEYIFDMVYIYVYTCFGFWALPPPIIIMIHSLQVPRLLYPLWKGWSSNQQQFTCKVTRQDRRRRWMCDKAI